MPGWSIVGSEQLGAATQLVIAEALDLNLLCRRKKREFDIERPEQKAEPGIIDRARTLQLQDTFARLLCYLELYRLTFGITNGARRPVFVRQGSRIRIEQLRCNQPPRPPLTLSNESREKRTLEDVGTPPCK